MIARQPYLPRFMSGGPGNPLGARAMYLGNTLFRIHGTNAPSTIGQRVSSGCVRLTNEDVQDLYDRVTLGAKVVVLQRIAARRARRCRECTCAAGRLRNRRRVEQRSRRVMKSPSFMRRARWPSFRCTAISLIAAPILTPALRDRASTEPCPYVSTRRPAITGTASLGAPSTCKRGRPSLHAKPMHQFLTIAIVNR